MNSKYISINCYWRITILLFIGIAMYSSVEAQTVTDVSTLEIIHRPSYMADKADDGMSFPPEFLQSGQGMIQKQVNGNTISIQNTSTYRMMRYVKRGVAVPLYLTTSQDKSSPSPQRTYQRWYNYDTEEPLVNGTTCDLSKGNFNMLRYKNGLVMGTGIKGGGSYAGYNFWGILPTNKERLNIAADLSCYNDWSYVTPGATTAANAGNLTEPSLTLRHIYELVDAKVMANELVTKTGDEWLEEHTIHFPSRSTLIFKATNDGSNFVPLNLELENYWFYTGNGDHTDANLQSVAPDDTDNYFSITSSGLSGVTNVGLYDAPNTSTNSVSNSTKKRRRLICFKYNTVPANSILTIFVKTKDPNNANRVYNIAKFTIIFDEDSEVVPYTDVVPENGAKHHRSTQSLREACHGADPVAHIDFDYPNNSYYQTPTQGKTYLYVDGNSSSGNQAAGKAFNHTSALPLAFDKTSYVFAPVSPTGQLYSYCVWGSYSIVDYVNNNSYNNGSAPGILEPVRTVTNDFLNTTDAGFLYIDASDMPGTVASVPFEGTFCMGTKMMCSGWISSWTNSDPGSVILKVIGRKPDDTEEEIYAFCPGQIGKSFRRADGTVATGTNPTWQQFYFEFFLNEPCVSYELKVENNCVSTSGGDYFLDDIWVFAQLPVVGPEMTTPLCGGDLSVVQLETNFDGLLLATGLPEASSTVSTDERQYLSFIYLDWDNFLLKFQEGLAGMGITISGHDLQENINSGLYDVQEYREVYREAFQQSIMRDTLNNNIVYGNFQWSPYFADHPPFSFAAMALDTLNTVYGATAANNQRRLVFNGAMGGFAWEFYHNYALLTTLHGAEPMSESELSNLNYISDQLFNVLNECSNRSILWFVPKVEIVGTIGGLSIEDLEFCEYTTQTFAMELAGYTRLDGYTDENGVHHPGDPVILPEVYFDWWMGVPKSEGVDSIPATVENYMKQYTTYTETVEGETVERKLYLYDAVRCFRFMNPDVTSLYSPNIKFGQNPLYANIPAFTPRMLEYMRSLANPSDGSKPQLYIHTKIVDVQINDENVVREVYLGDTIKYVKFVAIPIEANINEAAKDFVYICAEPQPFKVRVGDHAPHMQVGFSEKHYPAGLGTLSVRISKSQFEKLVDHEDGKGYKELHIPLRDINVVTPSCVGVKMATDPDDALRSVRIANSTDSLMQAFIMENMIFDENNSWPPAVGKIDYLVGKHDNYWSEGHPETERLLKIHFDKDFQVREGYSYTLRYYFIEDLNQGFQFTCNGNADIIIKIVPDYEVWTGGADNTDWSNDENWRRADYDELYAGNGTNLKDRYLPNGKQGDLPANTNYVTPADRERMQGFAPLYCTNILMMTKEKKDASSLYDDGDEVVDGEKTGFPALRATASPLIRYDFQTHEWVTDSVSAHSTWTHRALGDMVTELYNDNVCDSIAFQSETELVNAHLLNYNKAWVEYALPKNKWHLVGSPLQSTISGEWYAPTWSGRQETTYYEPINFDVTNHIAMTGISGAYPNGLDYDRFAPAVYQRQWDKAKAVLYERGAVWSANDASQTDNLGYDAEGDWTPSGAGFSWDNTNADDYLNRLVYKPFGESKINVAVRGSWSGAHNDHTVPYANGGFSVMPINNLKDHNDEDVKTIFRLPKDDQYYDIWDWSKGYGIDRRVRIYINDGRPLHDGATATNTVTLNNRGRLRSDFFAKPTPEEVTAHLGSTTAEDLAKFDLDKDGDIDTDDVNEASTLYEVTLKNEGEGSMGYFLACNPFICGLDMKKFFELNADSIYSYYLVMKDSDVDPQNSDLTDTYLATQPTGSEWKWTDMSFSGISDGTNLQGRKIVPPRYAFFLKKKEIDGKDLNQLTLKFTADMMIHTTRDENGKPRGVRPYLSILAERDGDTSEAMVMMSPNASNKFRPEEDLETFVVSDISSKIPVIYTLTGRLATSINRIHDFMVLPIGIESNSDKPATVTFQGVENLGDSLMLYDAKTEELLPLKSGTKKQMPGRTQNRFFIVKGENLKEALDESNLQIYVNDGIITVVSATGQPITEIHAYDPSGRQVYTIKPNCAKHRFRLPDGIYLIKANTDETRKVKKVMTR
ncbi:MAG: T9SS type A sorting domain-containing protein [Bacteroidaceae bacterium]|nr:T9SS type A sorting domain-containing protein [Bacteroidaceae bacterium]